MMKFEEKGVFRYRADIADIVSSKNLGFNLIYKKTQLKT
jgi:hypothetical protein